MKSLIFIYDFSAYVTMKPIQGMLNGPFYIFFYSIRLRTNDVVLTIAWTSLVFPTLRVTFKTSLSFNGKIKWIRICREASLLPRGMFEIFPLQYFNAVLTSLLNEVGH